MKYGSICSGIEAASVAFQPLDWEPAWFSEIEAFPSAVLAHHYPGVQNHGDMSNLADKILAGEIEAPDMICGGPPCQAFSVAGSRQSLSDKRGNLTLEYIRICDANDAVRSADGREATWILYENVPGLLSVSDNAFGAFLGGLVGRTAPIPEPADGWTGAGVVDGPTRCAAWRILDAQHFGLAQRRKRVFVLARGGAGRWAVADALLPIIEGSRWHPAPSRGAGKGTARGAEASTRGGGTFRWQNEQAGIVPDEVSATLKAKGTTTDERSVGAYIAHTLRVEGVDCENNGVESGEPMGPLMKGSPTGGGRPLPVVMATGQASAMSAPTIDMAPTLSCNHEAPILMRMREGKEGGGKGPLVSEDQSLTLATANDQVLCTHEVVGSLCAESGPNTHGSRGVSGTQTMLHISSPLHRCRSADSPRSRQQGSKASRTITSTSPTGANPQRTARSTRHWAIAGPCRWCGTSGSASKQ